MWNRVPVVVRALLSGSAMAAAGTLPWAILASLNIEHGSAFPWAVPPTALYLWLYWRYARGEGWPRSTAEVRRSACRANRVADDVWGMALLAGVLGLTALLLVQRVLSRLVTFSLTLMPFYLGVATVYGTLACLTNSIYPGILLHVGGNVLAALGLFAAGVSEWQAGPERSLIWETGADPAFWFTVGIALVVTGVALRAYAGLARVARNARTIEAPLPAERSTITKDAKPGKAPEYYD